MYLSVMILSSRLSEMMIFELLVYELFVEEEPEACLLQNASVLLTCGKCLVWLLSSRVSP